MATKHKSKPIVILSLKEKMAKLRVEDVSIVKSSIIKECELTEDMWRNRIQNKTVPSKPEQIIIDRIIDAVINRYKKEFLAAK